MAHLWDAERTIEKELALQLINDQFPQLEAEHIRLLGVGWDNTAFIVDETMIFRFPRRQIAVSLLEEEWKFLPKIANYLPLPIPYPNWRGCASAQFPWPFSGYLLVAGSTACHENLSEENRRLLVKPIAHFLKKLHAIPLKDFSFNPLYPRSSRIDGHLINEKIKKNFNELMELGILIDVKNLETVVRNSQNFKAPNAKAIVHGDFYVRHLLIDRNKQLSGVIDWGNVHIGDPANDIAIAHSFLPTDTHAQFNEAYGLIDEPTWQLSRLRAILSGTYLILFGHHSQDQSIKREGLRTLKIIGDSIS